MDNRSEKPRQERPTETQSAKEAANANPAATPLTDIELDDVELLEIKAFA